MTSSHSEGRSVDIAFLRGSAPRPRFSEAASSPGSSGGGGSCSSTTGGGPAILDENADTDEEDGGSVDVGGDDNGSNGSTATHAAEGIIRMHSGLFRSDSSSSQAPPPPPPAPRLRVTELCPRNHQHPHQRQQHQQGGEGLARQRGFNTAVFSAGKGLAAGAAAGEASGRPITAPLPTRTATFLPAAAPAVDRAQGGAAAVNHTQSPFMTATQLACKIAAESARKHSMPPKSPVAAAAAAPIPSVGAHAAAPTKIPARLNAEQARILADVRAGENVFITGGAGVGKSHTLRAVIDALKLKYGANFHKYVCVTASTGIAATHIGGCTLHAAAGVGVPMVRGDALLGMFTTPLRSCTVLIDACASVCLLVCVFVFERCANQHSLLYPF